MGRRSPAPLHWTLGRLPNQREGDTSLQDVECDFYLDDLAAYRVGSEIRFQRLAVAQVNGVIELELVNDWLAECCVVGLLGRGRRLLWVHRDAPFHPRPLQVHLQLILAVLGGSGRTIQIGAHFKVLKWRRLVDGRGDRHTAADSNLGGVTAMFGA